ncbi:MAG: NADH-ubiquinone oxidoreductase-F iron-sulfur binding region domain-containing protein [Armatimonadota bacterium]|nr:NADH-ubiquinone oxidoreductase-F iron-sulfur binding region domain-containing protein [Armatimonadota bacterium]MDR7450586.1 NADH-ubiquinone oxidoreductase-F iron-sulfur binding region domain-containing protein [Armatimonadota bacterium]MDR7466281.1 NADH-ubiquinone oxidoreductase-F iron-sulfur binding region domain-containing protein [Armatimonadota bacterium]MDR7493002.1 NADH-ubiquinone oxidoreductase-F iron-sulfur binding region domain-containing protein [Armatimonadota bacterium]MDR749824
MSRGARRPVESFYHLRDLSLDGRACQGTACFVARHLNAARWAAATSGIARVYCLGKCYLAPAANEDSLRPRIEARAPQTIVLERLVEGGATTLASYTAGGGYAALEAALRQPPVEVVQAVERADLRGRGGAGFPTGRKWRAVAAEPGSVKYVVANADEGDPGAYIDRFILEEDPFCLIEAMTIAGHATGARRGYIYLRKEYPQAREVLVRALDEARRAGLLGDRILGSPFSFEVELVLGQGSYVCGEETALLNAIEGKRPEVRTRPPYPATSGLFGRPTLVNNVETLASIPWIVRHGPEAYRRLGFSRSRGTKVVSLNSLFRRPGLYEIEFGVSVRHIVEELGGGLTTGPVRGVIIGGPLAGVLPPEQFDTPFGFEELRAAGAAVGHGGVVAFDGHTSILELVHHVFRFAAFESCGKCTPCRVGSAAVERMLAEGMQGRLPAAARAEFEAIVPALRQTSLCGHGIGLGEFVESIVRYYGKDVASWFGSR